MSENSHIDKILKTGIGKKEFANADAMWQKMDDALNKEDKKKRRPLGWILSLAALLIAGSWSVWQHNNGNAGESRLKNIAVAGSTANAEDNHTVTINQQTVLAAGKVITSGKNIVELMPSKSKQPPFYPNTMTGNEANRKNTMAARGKQHAATTAANAGEIIAEEISTGEPVNEQTAFEKLIATPSPLALEYKKQTPGQSTLFASPKGMPAAKKANTPDRKKHSMLANRNISIQAIAGYDAFRMNRKAGYYAGIRINRPLDNGASVSAGLNYSHNTVNDRYRLVSKPAAFAETDATINDIELLQMPVYFQQQLKGTKFSLMAGLVPSYVLKAEVYNVPNSFTGNPEDYRKFTMSDINRLNILFGASLQYAPLKRIAFELGGSYGFTGLVKNAYANQSRVNDNFKHVEAGVVIKLN